MGSRVRTSANNGKAPKEPLTKDTLDKLKLRERQTAKKSKRTMSLNTKKKISNKALSKRLAIIELPEYQRVHAAYLASMGRADLKQLAILAGVYANSIPIWKKKYGWEEELIKMKEAAENAIRDRMLKEGKGNQQNDVLYMVTPDQMRQVFAEMTGQEIERAVSELLSEIFVEDLRDLAKINKRVRFWLDHKQDDGSDTVIVPEVLKDLASIKMTTIKAVRLLFGMDSEAAKKAPDASLVNNGIIELTIEGNAAKSLVQIAQDITILNAKLDES